MILKVVARMNSSSALGQLGRGVGLTIYNNVQNSIPANGTWNRASKVGVADMTRPPTLIKDALDRTGIDVGITHCRSARTIYYKQYRKNPEWKGKMTSGNIQERLGAILVTEKQIHYLLSLRPKKEVFCYFHATGSIVSNLSEKPMYYYALVLSGSKDYGLMPIAEFLSDNHSIPQLTWFLSTFNHAVHQITVRKVVIKKNRDGL